MKVTSKVNKQTLKQIDQDAVLSLIKTADALKTDLQQSQTMPMDTGHLQNTATFVDDSKAQQGLVRVVSDTPYARRLYFHPELDFRKDKNPNAGAMWFEPYISGNKKDFIVDTFKKFMGGKL